MVQTPFKFGKTIAAIPLVSAREKTPDDTMCTISGWGQTEVDGVVSQDLMSVQLPIVSTVFCLKAYGETGITRRMFCAGYKDGSMLSFLKFYLLRILSFFI